MWGKTFACITKEKITIGEIYDITQMFYKSNSDVIRCGACYTDVEQRDKNKPYAIYVQMRDNSIKLLQPKPKHDAKVLTTIFPPP